MPIRTPLIATSRFVVFILFFSILGCQTPAPETNTCKNRDWFEIGRRDASQGLALDSFKKYGQHCYIGAAEMDNREIYLNGYNSGLAQFCSWNTGLELGRRNSPQPEICPPPYRKSFEQAYQAGQEIFRLSQKSQRLASEMDSIFGQLSQASLPKDQKKKLEDELSELRQMRALLMNQMNELEQQN